MTGLEVRRKLQDILEETEDAVLWNNVEIIEHLNRAFKEIQEVFDVVKFEN